MIAIQLISARIGRVTGRGIAGNMRQHYPAKLVYLLIALLVFANTVNIAADIAAMGDALRLVVGGSQHINAIIFGLLCLVLQIYVPYRRFASILKWFTLSLFAYVGVLFTVQIPWGDVVYRTAFPSVSLSGDFIMNVVAVFGTTISPYLFFWQASQEVEEQRASAQDQPLINAPRQASVQLQRLKIDTVIGMVFSNAIAFFIILTAAVTLHRQGITDIQTSAQAAEALRPVVGDFAFHLFAAGIIGTGLLAVPILASSAAYAVSEVLGWRNGLNLKSMEAKGFYGIVAAATIIGTLLGFTPIDPIKALYWSAVINGVIAVPIMAMLMVMAADKSIMQQFVISLRLKALGWVATLVMGLVAVAMFIAIFAT